MYFIIHAIDVDDALPRRLANYGAHKAYLEQTNREGKVHIVMSGPLVQDDGETMRGSFFLLEAENRQRVQAFHEADPFKHAGIWAQVSISAFLRRQG
ncbi:YciI family protein [Cupriavidus lacunae]|uniref:YciI family protein n=1 Tax=Cupriavidus lacunae TaxID=2666307 RepID=A0A370NIA5_9BURK|nr:YciI family protein [Cupriavidus lacunae]RDK05337.1 YciI family protein [Cupriavidus lacunae]